MRWRLWWTKKKLAAVGGATVLVAAAVIRYLQPATVHWPVRPTPAAGATPVATPVIQRHLAELPIRDRSPEPIGEGELKSMVAARLDAQTSASTRAWANALLTGDSDARAEAIRELGFLDDRRWVPVIMALLLRDTEATARAAAAAALATESDSPEAAHVLTAALTDPDPDVREDVLLSLKAIRNEVVQHDMQQLLAAKKLDPDTAQAVRLFLDRYYPHIDPLADPLAE